MQVLFLCILFVLPVNFVPQSQGSTHLLDSSTLYTASLEANRRFGDGSTPSFVTTFYDIEGKPAAHLFLVTKDQGSPLTDMETCLKEGREILEEAEALIQAGETEEGQKLIVRGKSLLFQEDRYGTLIVSAAEEGSSLVAFHHRNFSSSTISSSLVFPLSVIPHLLHGRESGQSSGKLIKYYCRKTII